MDLYHFQLGFPNVARPTGVIRLHYSRHASERAQDNKFGMVIMLPEKINFQFAHIVEMGIENGYLVHVVARVQYDSVYDICIAIALQNRVAKTIWLNRRDDSHHTLDRSKYKTIGNKSNEGNHRYVNGAIVRR